MVHKGERDQKCPKTFYWFVDAVDFCPYSLKQLGKIIRKIALNFKACCFLILILSFSDVSLRLAAMASLALLRFQSKLPTSYSRQFQMYIKFEKPSSTRQILLFELKY